MSTVGDSFAWAFRDPQWPSKMLVQGLIAIIPIVGWIAMNGWLMMAFENARQGKNELPPAGFHLERGFPIWVIFIVYGIVLGIPGGILYVVGALATNSSNNNGVIAVGALIQILGYLVSLAGSLFFRFLIPSLIVHVYRGGFSAGMDVQRVWQMATVNVNNSIVAGLIIFVASIIGGLGFIVCCIGLIFTVPYENTINAGAAAWWEKTHEVPSTAPTAPAT